MNGDIGKPMLSLLDTLLPIRRHSDPYRELIKKYERYRTELRPILPCYWAAFEEIEEWVEQPNAPNGSPPRSKFLPKPEDSGDDLANNSSIGQEATYSAPAAEGS